MLVRGGPANSGVKRPLREPYRVAWVCGCKVQHPSYYVRCERCRERRPS
jgi:hypothetical protein